MLLDAQHSFYDGYQAFIDDAPTLRIDSTHNEFFQLIDSCEYTIKKHGGSHTGTIHCNSILTRHGITNGMYYKFRPNPYASTWFVGKVEKVETDRSSATINLEGFVYRLNATPHEEISMGDESVLSIISIIMEDAREQPYSLPGGVVIGQYDDDLDLFSFNWRWVPGESALEHLNMLSVFTEGLTWGVSGSVVGAGAATIHDYDFYAFLGQPPLWRVMEDNLDCEILSETSDISTIINNAIITYNMETRVYSWPDSVVTKVTKPRKRIVYDKVSAKTYGLKTKEINLWDMSAKEFVAFQNAVLRKYAEPAVTRKILIHHHDVAGHTFNYVENSAPFPWNGRILLKDEGGLVIAQGKQSEINETLIKLDGRNLSFEVTIGDPKNNIDVLNRTDRVPDATITDPFGNDSTGITRQEYIFPYPAPYQTTDTYDEQTLEPPLAYPPPDRWYHPDWWKPFYHMSQLRETKTVVLKTNEATELGYYNDPRPSDTHLYKGKVSTELYTVLPDVPNNFMRDFLLPMMSLEELRKNKNTLVNWVDALARNRNTWEETNGYRDDGTIRDRMLTGWGIRWDDQSAMKYLHAGLQFHLGLLPGIRDSHTYWDGQGLGGSTNYGVPPSLRSVYDNDYDNLLDKLINWRVWITKVVRKPYRVTVDPTWDVASLGGFDDNWDEGTYHTESSFSFLYNAAHNFRYNDDGTQSATTAITQAEWRTIINESVFYLTDIAYAKAVSLGHLFALAYSVHLIPGADVTIASRNYGIYKPSSPAELEWYESKPALNPYPGMQTLSRQVLGGTVGLQQNVTSQMDAWDPNRYTDAVSYTGYGMPRKIMHPIEFDTIELTDGDPITTYEYRVKGHDEYLETTNPTS